MSGCIRPRIRPLDGLRTRLQSAIHAQMVGPVGIEPTTRGLKVRCSAN
jgi:hypothetical protein